MINKYTPIGFRTVWKGYQTPLNDVNLNNIEERIENISDYLVQMQNSGSVLAKGTIVGDNSKSISEDTYLSIQDGDINIARFCSSDITLFHNITTEGTIPYVPLLRLHMGDTDSDKSYIAFEDKKLALLYTDTTHNSIHQKDSATGIKGFYWNIIDVANKTIVLSSVNGPYGVEQDFNITDYWAVGDAISIYNKDKWENISKITSLSNKTITVDSLPFSSPISQTEHITDQAVFVLEKPDKGLCDFGQYSVALGDNCKSLSYATFSAGRDNTVIGQYGTAFGRQNTSSYCGLTAGRENTNLGDHSLVGGNKNENGAYAYASIIGGVSNINEGARALVFGTSNENYNTGINSKTYGFNALIGGEDNYNKGNNALVIGNSNVNNNSISSVLFGTGNTVGASSTYSITGGEGNTNNGSSSVLVGKSNTIGVDGKYAITGGDSNTNNGARSYLNGMESTNSGQNAIVSGYKCKSSSNGTLVIGNNNNSSGSNNVLGGINNTINGVTNCIVAGNTNTANHAHVVLFGQGHTSTRTHQILVGNYSKASSTTMFAVGDGTASNPRNAFEVLNSGKAKVYDAILATESYVDSGVNNAISTTKSYVNSEITKLKNSMGSGGTTNTTNIVIGTGNSNSANYSILGGHNNTNYGAHSLIVGGEKDGTVKGNTNSAACSIIGGWGNTNNADCSIMLGWSNTNKGSRSFVGGHDSSNNSLNSIVHGYNCHNEGSNCSLIVGDTISNTNNEEEGGHVLLVGYDLRAIDAEYSAVTGKNNTAKHKYIAVFGCGNVSTRDGQTLVGKYSNPTGNTLFAVGNGDENTRSNAFEVLPDGIKIGTTKITETQLNSLLQLI